MPFPHQATLKQQQGSVLLIGMIFLVILMIGATSIMNSAVQDERISGNTRANTEAFFAAEAGYSTLVNHLMATDQGKDASIAKSRWNAIDSEVNAYANAAAWNAANIDNKVDGFDNLSFSDAAGSKFTVRFAPVFDSSGSRVKNKILFVSEGLAGRSSRSIGFELEGSPAGATGPQAPAAISCFGAKCKLTPGAAKDKSLIDGRDHSVPPSDCTGNSCWLDPIGWNEALGEYDDPATAYSVPSVFLADRSSILETKGGNGTPYVGQHYDYASDTDAMSKIVFGSGNTSKSVWTAENYPKDENNVSTAPTYDDYFGSSPNKIMADVYEKAAAEITAGTESTLGTPDAPKVTVLNAADVSHKLDVNTAGVLIVNGNGIPASTGKGKKADYESVSFSGTGFYAGLIILRNCAQIDTGGNVSIYGAVIVDAKTSAGEDCGDDYNPFSANGHPDIKYSSEALEKAGVGTGTGGGFNGVTSDWYEITGY